MDLNELRKKLVAKAVGYWAYDGNRNRYCPSRPEWAALKADNDGELVTVETVLATLAAPALPEPAAAAVHAVEGAARLLRCA